MSNSTENNIKDTLDSFPISPDVESFMKDGHEFFKLATSGPPDWLAIYGAPETWLHGDNDCNGVVYVGSNAHVLCGKCGKETGVANLTFESCSWTVSMDNKWENLVSAMGIAAFMIARTGLGWFQSYMRHLPSDSSEQ